MSFAIVVGNGESRLQVPARDYDKKDTFACNLAYKHFTPKTLVCCDKNIFIKAFSENAHKHSQLWTRKRWLSKVEAADVYALPEDLPFPVEHKYDRFMDWGSGTYAAYLACNSLHDIIVMVGFDLYSRTGKVNNCFKGETGYGPADSDPVGPGAWIHQFGRLFQHYSNKQFVFLNEPDWKAPEEWRHYENFFQDDIRQLNNLA